MLKPIFNTYYTYILTNSKKTVLYIGVTNNMYKRLVQHKEGTEKNENSFAARYRCYFLVYYETYNQIQVAIAREKELKGWTRKKKESLINHSNPEWKFLNKLFSEQF